jgi:hypothetical protein
MVLMMMFGTGLYVDISFFLCCLNWNIYPFTFRHQVSPFNRTLKFFGELVRGPRRGFSPRFPQPPGHECRTMLVLRQLIGIETLGWIEFQVAYYAVGSLAVRATYYLLVRQVVNGSPR